MASGNKRPVFFTAAEALAQLMDGDGSLDGDDVTSISSAEDGIEIVDGTYKHYTKIFQSNVGQPIFAAGMALLFR